ncbi:MAG: Gfo/Idh/MocA family oxidoreductase [Verrucomicrobia bacterium]|nr:Gfo/Idh/MocA family oxidoreductase [Verrucomicrobiota bacterium]
MMTRRSFLKQGSVATGALLIGTHRAWAGANNRVRLAVVGIHGMGQNHIREYLALPNVEVVALCDVDENLFPEVIAKHFTKKNRPAPKTYTDIRKMVEDKEIDGMSVVTPNHWHTLASIYGIQAGKHVSVEKPCCHNFYEGRKLVEASKKYRVLVQDGAEQRSNPCSQTMAKFLHDGGLGEVYMAKGMCYKWRKTIGHFEDEPVPKGVHYDLWQGPAPARPFNKNRFHYEWHWNWDYGNGDMGNQGVHEMDIARWGLGVTLPTKISAIGGHVMFNDDQQTPNVLMAMFEFPNPAGGGDKKKILQFEVRHWVSNSEDGMWMKKAGADGYMATSAGNTVGNLFFGSKGYMAKNVNEWRTFMGEKREAGPTGGGLGNHYEVFVNAIRDPKPETFNVSIENGFYSCAVMHLGNISYRLGRSLEFDPKMMRFPHDEEANRMLRREYRAPFVVPEKV